jgi:hypothetical protein
MMQAADHGPSPTPYPHEGFRVAQQHELIPTHSLARTWDFLGLDMSDAGRWLVGWAIFSSRGVVRASNAFREAFC